MKTVPITLSIDIMVFPIFLGPMDSTPGVFGWGID